MARLLQISGWVILVVMALSSFSAFATIGYTQAIGIFLLGFFMFLLLIGLSRCIDLLTEIKQQKEKGKEL